MAKETTPSDFEDEDEDEDERYYLPSDSKCPAPEVHLLGLVVIWFGNLEFFLELSLCHLLTIQDNQERFVMAQAITAELSFRQKRQAFASMFRQKGILGAEPELGTLLGKLQSAEEKRNQLMHSAWNYTSLWGGQDLMRMKSFHHKKKGHRRGFHRMPAESIEETRRSIEEASKALVLFTMKYIQPPHQDENTTV